jgi:hypothetical protein
MEGDVCLWGLFIQLFLLQLRLYLLSAVGPEVEGSHFRNLAHQIYTGLVDAASV